MKDSRSALWSAVGKPAREVSVAIKVPRNECPIVVHAAIAEQLRAEIDQAG